MRRRPLSHFLSLALLILITGRMPVLLRAATGDILGAAIEDNGWICDVWISGLSTNGTFAYGFANTNNTITGSEKLRLAVTSQGFDATGAATTRARTLVGMKRIRFAYPNNAYPDTTNDGTGLKIKLALSQHVFSGDSNITATIASGLYTAGGTPNNSASSVTVTNGSLIAYPKVIANWTWPGRNRETGPNMRLRAMGFHYSSPIFGQGAPLACMKFKVTDEHSATVTKTQTMPRLDRTLPDLKLTGEYYDDFALSSFTDHDQLRCDFIAYPFIGDANSVWDTTLDTYTQPTPNPCAITNLCDLAGNYSTHIAVVDPASGNDTNGRATNVPPASVSSGHYFLTVTAAWNSLTASNNLYGVPTHNDPGGGIVYIKTTTTPNFNWTGGTLSAGATTQAKCWAETTTYPGDARGVITNRSNDRNIGHRTKLTNLEVAVSDPAVPFNGIGLLWFNQVKFNSAGTAFIQTCTNLYATHCTVTNMQQGFKAVSSQNCAWVLVRGNNFDGFSKQLCFYTAIGNTHPSTNGGMTVLDYTTAIGAAAPKWGILYNNSWLGGTGNPSFSFGGSSDVTDGLAIVQNEFEQVGNSGFPMAAICSSGNHPATNVVVAYNVFTGERIADWGSNGSETTTVNRHVWTAYQNACDLVGFKDDLEGGGNAARIGNWDVLNLVNGANNAFIECTVNSAADGFPPLCIGINTLHSAGDTESTGVTNTIGYVQYIDRKSYAGAGVFAAGGGNYRLSTHSPLQKLPSNTPVKWFLPYDLEGNARGDRDHPGPYAEGSPFK